MNLRLSSTLQYLNTFPSPIIYIIVMKGGRTKQYGQANIIRMRIFYSQFVICLLRENEGVTFSDQCIHLSTSLKY